MSSESLRYGRLREAEGLLADCAEVTETSINDAHNEIEVRTEIPNQLWGLPSSVHSVLKNEPHLELRDFQGSENGETMRLWIVVHMDEKTEAESVTVRRNDLEDALDLLEWGGEPTPQYLERLETALREAGQ